LEAKLLDDVRNVIRRRHYSIRTEQTYVSWIKRYILYHHMRHPREMGKNEIEAFLTHLAADCVRLRVKDCDFEMHQIVVRDDK